VFSLLPPYAMFGTKSDGLLYARSIAPGTVVETLLGASYFGALHKFRIDWNATTVVYWIDDVQVASHVISFGKSSMRPGVVDLSVEGVPLSVSYFRVTPYATSGTYTSKVFDARSTVSWQALSWNATVPTAIMVTVSYRTGNTATPDSTWST